LLAGALENGIDRIYLAGGLCSYRSIVDTEMYRHSLADFIPGILAHTDLPEIAATLSPRRLVITGPVDAAAAALAPRDARAVYDSALRQSNFELRDKAEWSAETLEEFCKKG
jgi:hypothetical protein